MNNITKYIAFLAASVAPFAATAQGTPATVAEEAADSTVREATVEVALGEVVPAWSYTGSVATVTSEEIDYWQTSTLDEALIGKLAGYYNNGSVRGLSSPNGEALLVVLDGVPAPTVTLSSLDPRSVESVSILKDAAAKALYGPLGAQGVFLVTTKKGHAGKTTVRAHANFGWEEPTTKAQMSSAYTYACLRNQALRNDGLAERYTSRELDAFHSGKGIDNDWRKLYMNDFRPVQNYNIEVAGGNDRTQFYVNAGYSHTGSLYKADFKEKYNPEQYQQQFNLVSNIQVKMFSFLKMFAATNVRIGHDNYSRGNNDGGGIIQSLYTTPPTVENGLVGGKVVADENFPNPIYGQINYKGVNKVTNTDVNAHFGLDFDLGFLTKGLTARAMVGYNSDYSGTREGTYDYSRWVRDENGELVRFGTANDDPLSWGKSSSMLYFMNFQAMVRWQREFGDHSFDAFVNYLGEDRLGKNATPAWLLPYNRIQLGGHFKYGYGNRYFVQFDCTYAGNEQMREGNQFHFSPTGSVAWVISNEAFLRDAEWLNLLKLRASFGALEYDVLGSMPSRYLYASEYRDQKGGPIDNIYTGTLLGEGVLGNPSIKWEKSYQQVSGFDLPVLDNSLTLNFDYWRTKQRDVIYQDMTVPSISGISPDRQAYSNIGKTSGEGVDFQVSYTKSLPYGIGLTVTGDFGWNRNKVEYGADLDYSGLDYAYAYRKTGYAIGQQWGYLVDYSNGNGFYNSQAEIDKSGLVYDGTAPRPGDFRYRDLNGDGRIDEADKAPLDGVKSAPSINYGASVKLTWNNFDLYVFLQGESGRNGFYNGLGVWENVSQGVYMTHHRQSWTPERYAAGEAITYPALTSTTSSSLAANDFFTSKADFFRLKNVTLGYSLPAKWMKKIGMNQIRFYFTGQNLLTATNLKFKGIDPERSSIDNFVFRSYNFGLNVSF